jgi:predicted metalloendopeptidase
MVMGHEFTHGFDDEGAKYDADGNLQNWWTPATTNQFKARTGCVINQYSSYEPLPGLKVNGELTTGENIADIGGLKLAFQAYHEARKSEGGPAVSADGFSEDQQFFLSFAQSWCTKLLPDIQKMMLKVDSHSPARFRVNGPVSDNPRFAEAFACKVGTKMNPSDACSIW